MRRSILAACLAVLTACTAAPPPFPEPREVALPVATVPDCPGTASCVTGVTIGKNFYAIACETVPDELVYELVATGGPGVPWKEFRTLEGAESGYFLAGLETKGGDCQKPGLWVTFTQGANTYSREEAFARYRDGCRFSELDGPPCTDRVLEWKINAAKEHIGYAYLPERIQRVNAAVAAGDPEYTWRNDPFEVLLREPYWQRCGKHAPPQLRCRAGAWATERSESRIAITVLQQGVSKGQYSSYETLFWLERLDGGTGWWLVERKKGRYTLHPGRGEPSKAASDARWADCCDVVLFDGGTE